MDQLRTQIKLPLIFNLNSAVWGVRTNNIHPEGASRAV